IRAGDRRSGGCPAKRARRWYDPSTRRRPRASGCLPQGRAMTGNVPSPLAGEGQGEGYHTKTAPVAYPLPQPLPARGRGAHLSCGQDRGNHFVGPALLIPRLQISLAVIAAPGAARRAVAGILLLVARPRLRAAGPLHQHAAALAITDQCALARRLERLLAARRLTVILRVALLGPRKVGPGPLDHPLAELFAQHSCSHFLDLAFLEFAELERAVGDADQAVHLEAEMRHDIANLAVLAFADRKHQPDIAALIALQRGVDRSVFDAVDLDAVLELVELSLCDLAMRTHAITPQPAGLWQFQFAREPAVIGQQQQTLGVEIEPADRDQPRQTFGQIVEHGRPSLGIGVRRHQPLGLVIEEQPRALARRQRLSIDSDHVIHGDVERRRIDEAAVDGDAPLRDDLLGVAARGEPCACQHFRDTLAGFLRLCFLARGALVEISLSLAIGAATAEGRALRKDLAVVLIVPARAVGEVIGSAASAARMLLPVHAALGTRATVAIEARAIAAMLP